MQVEDEDGDFKIKHLFQLEGEEAAFSSPTVTFKVFDAQNKLIKRDVNDSNKIVSESVFFEGIRKDTKIPDSTGTNACGRVFPAWIDDFKSWSQDKKDAFRAEQKKEAGWYTFIFGEVTFPGKQPVLVNMRLTGRLSVPFGDLTKKLGREKDQWPTNLVEIKAKGLKGKPQFVDLTFDIKQSGLVLDEETTVIQEITDFINAHNDNIILKQKAA